jgi:hypothetical protein
MDENTRTAIDGDEGTPDSAPPRAPLSQLVEKDLMSSSDTVEKNVGGSETNETREREYAEGTAEHDDDREG